MIASMTYAEYEAIPGVRISNLIEILRSPKHYRYRVDHSDPKSKPQSLGTLVHMLTLEPHRESDVVVWDRTTDSGTSAPRRGKYWDTFCAAHQGQVISSPSEYATALAISRAIMHDPHASALIKSAQTECVMRWSDDEIQCKARLDGVGPNSEIFDLKTTSRIDRFRSESARYHYPIKMAWYGHGYEMVTGVRPQIYLIAAETSPPYDVACFSLDYDSGTMRYARETLMDMIETLKRCVAADTWPGVAGGEMQQFDNLSDADDLDWGEGEEDEQAD